MKKSPRYNVVSVRLSDDERDILGELMDLLGKSASDVLRESLRQYIAGIHK